MVEWGGLENRCASDGTGGSNPSSSANFRYTRKLMFRRAAKGAVPLWGGFAALEGDAGKTATLLTHRGNVSILYAHYKGNASRADKKCFRTVFVEQQ